MTIKIPSLLLCLLSLAAPLCAQDAPNELKDFGINFNYSYSGETHVTSAEVGLQREFPNAKPVPFDSTIMGKKGLITRETLSFLDEKGAVLGTLSSEFDPDGRLQSQKLGETNQEARALDWFKTSAKSPQLTVAGSVLQAAYTLKSGKLSDRVLTYKLPTGSSEIRTHYDESGRRESDMGSRPSGAMAIRYSYVEEGLSGFTITGGKDKPHEISLLRSPDGLVSQVVTKEDGVLVGRVIPTLDNTGKSLGMRIETLEAGILASALAMNFQEKTTTEETYDDGILVSRKASSIDAAGKKLQSLEEFEDGHLQKRTDYDDTGAVKSITTFNTDGSVKTTRTFQNGVEVTPAK